MKALHILAIALALAGCAHMEQPAFRVSCEPEALAIATEASRHLDSPIRVQAGPSVWSDKGHAEAATMIDGEWFPLVKTTTRYDGVGLVMVGEKWESGIEAVKQTWTLDEYHLYLMTK
jgi:hypothetical protein